MLTGLAGIYMGYALAERERVRVCACATRAAIGTTCMRFSLFRLLGYNRKKLANLRAGRVTDGTMLVP